MLVLDAFTPAQIKFARNFGRQQFSKDANVMREKDKHRNKQKTANEWINKWTNKCQPWL